MQHCTNISCDWENKGNWVNLSPYLMKKGWKTYENNWHFDPVVSRQCPETIRNCGMQLLQQDGCIAAAQPITSWASAPKENRVFAGLPNFWSRVALGEETQISVSASEKCVENGPEWLEIGKEGPWKAVEKPRRELRSQSPKSPAKQV